MQDKTTRLRLLLGLAVAGACLALSAFLVFRSSNLKSTSNAPVREQVSACEQIPARVSSLTTPSADDLRRQKEKAALEVKLAELNKAIADADAKIGAARSNATEKEIQLKKEIADLRKAIAEALEKHPLVVAKRAEYEELEKSIREEARTTSASMAALGKARKEKKVAFEAKLHDVNVRLAAERQAYLKEIGKGAKVSHLDAEEQKKLMAIQDKYASEGEQLAQHRAEYISDDDAMKAAAASHKSYVQDVRQREDALARRLNAVGAVQQRLQNEDPVIVGMLRDLSAKSQEVIVIFSARPEVQDMMREIAKIQGEEMRVSEQVRLLSIDGGPKTVAGSLTGLASSTGQ